MQPGPGPDMAERDGLSRRTLSGRPLGPEERRHGQESPGEFKYHESGSAIHECDPEEQEAADQVHRVVGSIPGPEPAPVVAEVCQEDQERSRQRNELIEHE
jgi:hypothetical protein